MHELPLVFFTVFGQAAVGIFLLSLLAFTTKQISDVQLKTANIVAAALLLVGSAIGGLHMGQPLRAFNLLFGLGRSPMSNEIILSGLFMACAAATVALSFMPGKESLYKLANKATVLAGLLFAWSIPQVYQLATVASWDTAHTSLQMWLTVLVAGGAFALMLGAHKLGFATLAVGALVSLAAKPNYIGFVTQAAPELAVNQYSLWGAQAVALLVAVLIGCGIFSQKGAAKPLLIAGAGVMLVGELIGRIAFYNLWAIPM
ncbi:dimethyl sulfoxide reductase anchor subunit [Photobacterium sp. BZF1]|uniref:dimethyl sulfoxide reductase anchor subunit family protein n=1 Tax=Photobacterium sp. BZF1 TaxID=1904457 RepID=UPI0016534A1D|nr:DmsC/YnfH family molybdoenzyme membrane anchor subunit [Photobacterium sp. BZF1]MBC7005244.1 dimethyl sulfoxide reductase anchor subunit [Photobacterium sp. BZF1]